MEVGEAGEAIAKPFDADDEKVKNEKSKELNATLSKALTAVATMADTILPFVLKYYTVVEQYYAIAKSEWDKRSSPEINEIMFGFFLCFYGGQFPALLAAIVAIKQSGQWPKLKKGGQEILKQVTQATTVLQDDKVVKMLDTDNDGKVSMSEIAAGLQENGRGLITEAMPLVLTRVDPTVLNESITSVWAIIIQVSVTLQSVFARQIALGMRVGDVAGGGLKHFIVPRVSKNLSKEYKQWADWGFSLAAKVVGVVIAMFLAKLVGGFHSALQGGEFIAKGAVAFGQAHGVVQQGNVSDLKMGLMYFFGLVGFWSQVRSGFSMNVIFKVLLLPAIILEWCIAMFCYAS